MTCEARLIVTADDFGRDPETNAAVELSFVEGRLTRTSLLANGVAYEDALAVKRRCPELGIGVHLNLVRGTPLSAPEEVPSLVDASGRFWSPRSLLLRLMARQVRAREVKTEFDRQIRRVREGVGTVTHLDGEKHLHVHPAVVHATVELARAHEIREVRLPCPGWRGGWSLDRWGKFLLLRHWSKAARAGFLAAGLRFSDHFVGFWEWGQNSGHAYPRLVDQLRSGCTELMVHPTRSGESWRVAEYRSLMSPEYLQSIQRRAVCLAVTVRDE